MDAQTGLPYEAIAGCVVDDSILGRARGHNDRIIDLIAAKGLPGYSWLVREPGVCGIRAMWERRLAAGQHAEKLAGTGSESDMRRVACGLGTTEFMMALKEQPEQCHVLLNTITDFLVEWLRLQKQTLPTIDGIFALDDLVGFLGEEDFVAFAKPYLTRMFQAFPASVRFFHNDAHGLVCAPHLHGCGINLFNFSFQHSLAEMRRLLGPEVTMLGNVPPRDVLAAGTPEEVRQAVRASVEGLTDRRRLIVSVGGGMSPGTPTENVEAFLEAAAGLA